MFAYPVLARNDLADSLLQILDLKPNTSLDLPSLGAGQTGYRSDYFQNQAVAVNAGPPITINGTTYGVRAYILDTIEDPTGNAPTSVADAATIANLIFAQVAAGGDLLVATLNAFVVAVHGAGSSSPALGERHQTGKADSDRDSDGGTPIFFGRHPGATRNSPQSEIITRQGAKNAKRKRLIGGRRNETPEGPKKGCRLSRLKDRNMGFLATLAHQRPCRWYRRFKVLLGSGFTGGLSERG